MGEAKRKQVRQAAEAALAAGRYQQKVLPFASRQRCITPLMCIWKPWRSVTRRVISALLQSWRERAW